MWPKYDHLIAKTWSPHGPSNGFFLIFNQCAKGFSMLNFTLLSVSCSRPFPEMAKIWPFMSKSWSSHGPSNLFSGILINMPRDVPYPISYCWVYPVAPFSRKGKNMALLWPKDGPYMVLQICSSLILIYVPRDDSCQISHCWVYPVAPFSRNGQN